LEKWRMENRWAMQNGCLVEMKSGQFYKGMINGVEESYESPDLFQVLPADKLNELWDLSHVGRYRRVFLNERVVAQSVVSEAEPDDMGRDGIINHTVLHRFDLYTTHEGAIYRFDIDKFAEEARAGKYDFPMPDKPQLKKPLDYPPRLEVKP
jgi:hypothetical protein